MTVDGVLLEVTDGRSGLDALLHAGVTSPHRDDVTDTPEYKVTAVRLER